MKEKQLYERVLDRLDLTRDIDDEELEELIHQVLREEAGEEYIPSGTDRIEQTAFSFVSEIGCYTGAC